MASNNKPWFSAPSPKKTDGDVATAVPFGAEGGTHGKRNAAPDNAVRSEIPIYDVEDVETAATAEPISGAAAHDLRHQAAHVGALCQAVAVAAMVTRNLVAGAQLRADAYRYCFLAGAEVHKARYHPAKEETADLLLERTNELHSSQQ